MSDERKPLEPSETLIDELLLAAAGPWEPARESAERFYGLIRDYVLEEAAKAIEEHDRWSADILIRGMKGNKP